MTPLITGIAHVELSVSDLERTVEWYCRLLGARDVYRNRSEERPDRSALEVWQARLDELGIEHDAIDDQGFAVALNLRDPDGIALEFYFLQRRAV